MHIQGIIFDLDGTLADTLPICIQAYQETLKHFTGRSFTEEEITAHFGLIEAGILQRIIPEHWEEGLKLYFEIYERLHVECTTPFPGIDRVLQLLKERGILMAVVTGKGDYTAAYTLKYLGIAQYFEHVEVGDANTVVKAQAIGKILTAWNMEPRYAAYVGDTYSDMEQAVTAGVLPLGAAWGETSTLASPNSTIQATTFPTIDSFIDWLKENVEALPTTQS
jgi:phosphoglycolate phosphatase-like HAD superfamily hydrolase